MNRFINLKVSNKLLVSFAAVLVCVGILGATSAIDLGRVSSNTDTITGNLMPSMAWLNKINFDAANLRIQELRAVTSDKPDEMARHLHESEQFIGDVAASRNEYLKYVSGDQERALWNAYDRNWQDYLQLHQKMVGLLGEHKSTEALNLIGQGGKKIFDDARDGLVADLKFNQQRAEQVTETSKAISSHARMLIIGLLVAALV